MDKEHLRSELEPAIREVNNALRIADKMIRRDQFRKDLRATTLLLAGAIIGTGYLVADFSKKRDLQYPLESQSRFEEVLNNSCTIYTRGGGNEPKYFDTIETRNLEDIEEVLPQRSEKGDVTAVVVCYKPKELRPSSE